ncbi:MAG: FHA domain-containing protein [Candidatus Dormibacteraceae bacterium]
MIVGRATGDWRTAPDIDLGSPVVSRRHAQLECGANGVLLRDLGSSNGTTVQGQLLSEGELILLREGDVISFGGVEGRFEAAAPWPKGLRPAWNPEGPADLTRPGLR